MRYFSTRGAGQPKPFEDIILQGIAPDGGLYLPDQYPPIRIDQGSSCLDVAEQAIAPFAPDRDEDGLAGF